MSKVLVIVESPAKAKTIEKFLGRKFMVKASMGHVRDLPKSQFGVDVEQDFLPKYINIRGKGDIIKELKAYAKDASHILLGPDPDREGEAIAWHLSNLLGLDPKDKCRIEFNEITQNAIQNAVKKPRSIDADRVDAQQARRVLDRVVGYKLSPLLWRKIHRGLSAGRVQSVAVRLISDRENEIAAFVPEEYWNLIGHFTTEKQKLTARLYSQDGEKASLPNEAAVKSILKDLDQAKYQVVQVKKRDSKRNPAPPFTTSTLQQEAYRKLNFTARRTMSVAQQLYEGLDLGKEGTVGLITYIRTDSTRVSQVAQEEARTFITERFGPNYIPKEPRQYAAKGRAQDAHEGIRPTYIGREPETLKKSLTSEQYRLYRLIWERFVASQMSSALVEVTTADIAALPGKRYVFRATGSVIKFPGFMKVYIEGRDENGKEEEVILPELKEGQPLNLNKLEPRQHFTQPPPRYTEATLVKTLEEKGIGRPSTYAPIVETILARGYVTRQEKQFYPTELGSLVVELLKNYFQEIINVEFTANLEEKLDLIEEGQLPWKEVVRGFYFPFSETLKLADEQIGGVEIGDEETDEPCPQCGRNLVIKRGPFGKFLACPGFPECRTTKPILEPIGVDCPRCEAGMVARQSKRGRRFYGCSRYPECGYICWDPPTGERCSQCGDLIVEKTTRSRGKYKMCSNPECPTRKGTGAKAKAKKTKAKAGAKSGTKAGAKSGAKSAASSTGAGPQAKSRAKTSGGTKGKKTKDAKVE
ncbi:MAG: type I DNA topoisomerase [Firmicutes bacterium]|nr:type I DNA topoisomerase [Bacillota bacterium]